MVDSLMLDTMMLDTMMLDTMMLDTIWTTEIEDRDATSEQANGRRIEQRRAAGDVTRAAAATDLVCSGSSDGSGVCNGGKRDRIVSAMAARIWYVVAATADLVCSGGDGTVVQWWSSVCCARWWSWCVRGGAAAASVQQRRSSVQRMVEQYAAMATTSSVRARKQCACAVRVCADVQDLTHPPVAILLHLPSPSVSPASASASVSSSSATRVHRPSASVVRIPPVVATLTRERLSVVADFNHVGRWSPPAAAARLMPALLLASCRRYSHPADQSLPPAGATHLPLVSPRLPSALLTSRWSFIASRRRCSPSHRSLLYW
ncbi:hypothetical protein Scep_021717 [Stephania cephalantha]|uniref:Uncharacterized protein n=1 Tax=Stephania cephalantha TaxID=152367 RepID=A0AAP0FBZ7_9MAGN